MGKKKQALRCKDHNNANIIYVREKNPKKLDVDFTYNSALIIDGGHANFRPKGLNQLDQQKIKHLQNTLTRILTLSLHSSHKINDGQKSYIYNTLISETGSCRQKSTLLNGPATSASFQYATGITVDTPRNVYIADNHGHRIRKVDTNGNRSSGYSGDGEA